MRSLQGHLLVASPHMADQNFARTVVLLMHHSAAGAHGLVLNRPIDQTIKGLWEALSEDSCEAQGNVNFGGPMAGPLMALHNCQALGDGEVPPGIYVAAQRQHLECLVHQNKHPYRFFVGHAGWAKGQLEAELARGDWFVTPAKMQHVFADCEQLWPNTIRNIGRFFVRSVLKVKHTPHDVSLN